jgi:hypothetical protein
MVKRVIVQTLAWAGLIAFCGAIALAQNGYPAQSSAQAAGSRSDGQIEMDVVHALDASKALKNDLITAATIQGEVTLSGTVSNESSRELAESIASRVAGVAKVNNNLTVGDPQAAANAADQQMADSQPEDSMAPIPPPPPADGPQVAPGESPYPGSAQGQSQNQAQDQSQGQYQAPPARPQYLPANPQGTRMRPPAYETPTGPVTISEGTLLQLRTNEPVASKRAKDGTPVEFTVIHDVAVGGVLAIPRGATVHGVVTEVKQSGQFAGRSELALALTSLDLGGQSYPLQTDQFKVRGPGKGGQTANNVIGGAMMGTIIGCIAGRGVGCAIGAGAGAAAGTAVSAASSGPGAWIPSEARVDFHLAAPLTVNPVSQQEAARLAQGLYPGGPTLYRRPAYPYARPYVVGYPYGYPPVYYRPYYMVGGFYYWR